jgi:hypothetical protein
MHINKDPELLRAAMGVIRGLTYVSLRNALHQLISRDFIPGY